MKKKKERIVLAYHVPEKGGLVMSLLPQSDIPADKNFEAAFTVVIRNNQPEARVFEIYELAGKFRIREKDKQL